MTIKTCKVLTNTDRLSEIRWMVNLVNSYTPSEFIVIYKKKFKKTEIINVRLQQFRYQRK